jgi:hypothetical protein
MVASASQPEEEGVEGSVVSSSDHAIISDDAMSGFGGVLQINQVSGQGNSTGNRMFISL